MLASSAVKLVLPATNSIILMMPTKHSSHAPSARNMIEISHYKILNFYDILILDDCLSLLLQLFL